MMPMSEVSNPEIKDTIEKIQKQLDELKKQHGMFKENPSGNFESSKNESELGDWAKEESDYNVKLE